MKTQVYKGHQARQMFNMVIGDESVKVVTPIHDQFTSGEWLGHLLIFQDAQIEKKNNLLYSKLLTEGQKNLGILGSFMFIGTNSSYFHHLFLNTFTGKYTKDHILIDSNYKPMITYDFVMILQKYIQQYA